MFGIETLGGNAQAVVLVGIVLFEALLLYVGYGGLETVVGPAFTRVLKGQCAVLDAVFMRCSAAENGGADR
ncbi:DUF7512 family protein [Halorientalis halophila]|uniref:DUF7512 family protein n=1 Tax=Halorientalis halophila TaxID=3108499 RepID=UPI0030098939